MDWDNLLEVNTSFLFLIFQPSWYYGLGQLTGGEHEILYFLYFSQVYIMDWDNLLEVNMRFLFFLYFSQVDIMDWDNLLEVNMRFLFFLYFSQVDIMDWDNLLEVNMSLSKLLVIPDTSVSYQIYPNTCLMLLNKT